jgi:hypothetical protein
MTRQRVEDGGGAGGVRAVVQGERHLRCVRGDGVDDARLGVPD